MDQSTTYIPDENNTNYVVSTFNDGSDDYVAFINADGTSAGSNVTYGYDTVSNLSIPEPSTYVLLSLGVATVGFVARRKRNQ
ncbi:MAG: PEP-CTERM sorting domain-containing protein [Verrucomicrobiota bacterium]